MGDRKGGLLELGMKTNRMQTNTNDYASCPISQIISHIFSRILELDTDHSDINIYLLYI